MKDRGKITQWHLHRRFFFLWLAFFFLPCYLWLAAKTAQWQFVKRASFSSVTFCTVLQRYFNFLLVSYNVPLQCTLSLLKNVGVGELPSERDLPEFMRHTLFFGFFLFLALLCTVNAKEQGQWLSWGKYRKVEANIWKHYSVVQHSYFCYIEDYNVNMWDCVIMYQ